MAAGTSNAMNQCGCCVGVQWVVMQPIRKVSQGNYNERALYTPLAPHVLQRLQTRVHLQRLGQRHTTFSSDVVVVQTACKHHHAPTPNQRPNRTHMRRLTAATTYDSVCKLEFTSNALPSATPPSAPMLLFHKLHAHIITHQHRINVATAQTCVDRLQQPLTSASANSSSPPTPCPAPHHLQLRCCWPANCIHTSSRTNTESTSQPHKHA